MPNKKLEKLKQLKKQTEITIQEKSAKSSLIINIIVVFTVVLSLATGLRIIHDMIIMDKKLKDYLSITPASAAELINASSVQKQSHTDVNIRPNTGFTFTLQYKNEGTTTWNKKNVYLKSLTTALKFRHSFWPDPFLPAQLQEQTVEPGQIGTFVFALQAPPNFGDYTGEFVLVNDNVLIRGGETKIRMNVVAEPEKIIVEKPSPENEPDDSPQICTLNLRIAGIDAVDNVSCIEKFSLPELGPIMRIGLFYLGGPFHPEESVAMFNTKAWQVYDQNDILLASIPANIEVRFFYNSTTKQYSFDYIDKTIRTDSYLKLANNNDGLFTITSYNDIPSYNKNINYNDYLGNLEIRHNDCSIKTWGSCEDKVWVIETLPLETYLAGIQETTNYDPIEYQKTMSVAARTYAMYHYDRYSKHDWEFYHVDSRYDQVYKGQVSMLLFPNVKRGVDETAGIIATYDDKIIVAPYFSRSDGRTRSYEEVWNSTVPYLVSVPAPYSEGKTLFGHGVGIDASDALQRAKQDGWTYDQLLKYYYTNITLEKIY